MRECVVADTVVVELVSALRIPCYQGKEQGILSNPPLSQDFEGWHVSNFNGFKPYSLHDRTGNFFKRTGKYPGASGNYCCAIVTSALTHKADIDPQLSHVRFVPTTDITPIMKEAAY